jgi:hypothetical protein
MKMPMPEIYSDKKTDSSRMLITAEGFEERSLSFLTVCRDKSFEKILICRYFPEKKAKYTELKAIIDEKQPQANIKEITFNRFEPFSFELEFHDFIQSNTFQEIVIDISVMSKYMILQILCSLSSYKRIIRIIYTEPENYAPMNSNDIDEQSKSLLLPSTGVQNIVRTPLLTSLIMQHSPTLLVAFLSFNEQLIRALLSECTPARLFLINGVPPNLTWREKATNDMHGNIIKEYAIDNPIDKNGLLLRKSSTLNYIETFEILSEIYKTYGERYRIVVAPTGSKMQAVACALIKNCCEDIHIEYPTPESFYIEGYSSSEIKQIHQLVFNEYAISIQGIANEYKLNG